MLGSVRRTLAVLLAFALGLALSASASAKEKDKAPPKDKEKPHWGPFTAYAGARKLCQEHVLGNSLEITWQTYATGDPVTQVVAFYEKDLGKKAEAGPSGDFTLHGNTKVDDVITIFPVEKAEAHPSCAEKPKAGERTVILVAQATALPK